MKAVGPLTRTGVMGQECRGQESEQPARLLRGSAGRIYMRASTEVCRLRAGTRAHRHGCADAHALWI